MAQELAESILSPSTNSGLALSKDSHNPRRKVDSGRRLRRAQGGVRGAFDILNSTKLSTKDLPPTKKGKVIKGNVSFFGTGQDDSPQSHERGQPVFRA